MAEEEEEEVRISTVKSPLFDFQSMNNASSFNPGARVPVIPGKFPEK